MSSPVLPLNIVTPSGTKSRTYAPSNASLSDLRKILIEDAIIKPGTKFHVDGTIIGLTAELHIKWTDVIREIHVCEDNESTHRDNSDIPAESRNIPHPRAYPSPSHTPSFNDSNGLTQSLGKGGIKFGGKPGIIRACNDKELEDDECDSELARSLGKGGIKFGGKLSIIRACNNEELKVDESELVQSLGKGGIKFGGKTGIIRACNDKELEADECDSELVQSLGKSGMKFGGTTGIIRACGDEEPEDEECDPSVASNSCSSPITAQPPGAGCDPIEKREDNTCTQPRATQQGTCGDNDECAAVASCQGKDRQECPDGQYSAQQGNCTDDPGCPPVPACQDKYQPRLKECFGGPRSRQATNGTKCTSDYPGNEECKEDSASCADRSNAETKARNPKFRPLRLSADSTLFQDELSFGFGKPKTPRSNGSNPNQQRTPPRPSSAMKSYFNLITANLQTNQDLQSEELQMNGSACYDANETVQVVNSCGQSGLSIQANAADECDSELVQSLGKSGMKFGGKTGIIRACGDEEPEGEVCDSSVASNSCSSPAQPPGEGCDPIEEREDNPCTQPCATQQGTCVDNDECGAVASCQGKDRQECSDGQCSAQQGNCTDSAVCPPVPACQVKDQLKLEECFDCTGSAVCPPVPACQDQLKLEECCDGDRSYQATNGTECMSDYPGNEECKEDSASCADRSNADTKARNPKFRPLRLSTDSTLFQGELSPGFGKPKTPRSNGSHPNQQRTPPRSSIAMKSDFNLITANLQTNQDPQPEELQMNGSACYDASEAVQVVNSYGQSGLSIQNNAGSVWTANTRDQSLQNTFSQRLRSGTIRGNCFSNVTLGASVTHIGEIADVEVKASSDGEIHRETRLDMFSPMKSLSGSVDGSWRQRLDIVNTIKTVMQVGCVDSARFAAVFEGLQVDSNLFQGVASSVEESYLMSLEIEQAKVGGNGCLNDNPSFEDNFNRNESGHCTSPSESTTSIGLNTGFVELDDEEHSTLADLDCTGSTLPSLNASANDPITPPLAKVPLYRLYSPSLPDHFYTTNAAERDACMQYGYTLESTAAQILASPSPDGASISFFRIYRNKEHFYTADVVEKERVVGWAGTRDEGIAGYVYAERVVGTVPLYRLYNSGSDDHFYTTSAPERETCIQSGEWNDEGVACYVYP